MAVSVREEQHVPFWQVPVGDQPIPTVPPATLPSWRPYPDAPLRPPPTG